MIETIANSFQAILLDHAWRYPGWMAADVYKLAHQAALGSEHAVTDDGGVRAWMERELATLGEGKEEPLVDPISASGEVIRIHLRPYIKAGYSSEALLDAFIRTAREYSGSYERLQAYLGQAVQLAGHDGLNLPGENPAYELYELVRRMQKDGYPAVHHSEQFEALYHPAYRAIAREFLPGELEN
jgi:hypothetical protein